MPDSTVTLVVPGNVASAYLDPSDNHMCDVIGLPPADIRPKGRGEHWVYAEVSPTVALDTAAYLRERAGLEVVPGKDGAVHRAAVKAAKDIDHRVKVKRLNTAAADDTIAGELSTLDIDAAADAAEVTPPPKPKRRRGRKPAGPFSGEAVLNAAREAAENGDTK